MDRRSALFIVVCLAVMGSAVFLAEGREGPDRELPDLTGIIERAPEMAAAGEDLGYIYVSVKNEGNAAKKKNENYCVFLILSKDKKIPVARPSLDGVFREDMAVGIGMCSSRKLKPGKVWKIDYFGEEDSKDQMMIHKDTPPGDYFLAVVVDADKQIQESNEENNVHYIPITVM